MMTRVRWLVAVAAGLAVTSVTAAPVPVLGGDKAEPPTLTFHTLPGQRVTADIKAVVKLIGGEDAVGRAEGTWESLLLGKNTALDLTRPVAGYAYLRPNVPESSAVFLLPTADEKTTLGVLDKLGLKAEATNGVPGRYKLAPATSTDFPVPVILQFADAGKLAYVAVNAKPDLLNRDKLIPPGKLIDPTATAHVTATVYPDRVPPDLRKLLVAVTLDDWKAGLDQLEQRKPRDMPAGFPAFAKEVLAVGGRNLPALYTESQTVTVGLRLDPKTANVEAEVTVSPKNNTPFAADIVAVKRATGRFHQLLTKDAVLGGQLALPTLPKALRETGGQFLADWIEIGAKDAPGDVKPLFDAVAVQVKKSVADGTADAGFALTGPNKGGRYTGVAAVGVADAAGIDKAFRAAAKMAGDFVKLDAGKLNDLPVHEVSVKPALTPDLARIFGAEPKLRLLIAKDAIYAALGDEGEVELKRATALKPAAGPVLDMAAHAARGVKLLNPAGFNQPIIDLGGRIDGWLSYIAVDVTGGTELKVKVRTAAPLFGLFAFGTTTVGPGAPPPPPPLDIKKN